MSSFSGSTTVVLEQASPAASWMFVSGSTTLVLERPSPATLENNNNSRASYAICCCRLFFLLVCRQTNTTQIKGRIFAYCKFVGAGGSRQGV